MTNAASKPIGLQELQPEPCDGTGTDAMSKRFHKWHRSVPLEEVILDPTQPIDLAALCPVPCNECPNDPITKRMLAKWKPRVSTAPKTATAAQAVKPAAPAARAGKVLPQKEQVDENNNECKADDEGQVEPRDDSSGPRIYTYDSKMFRGSYPMCKAEHRTGLGKAYAKYITAPPRAAGAMQRGPGGPPRGPGGPPRGPGGPGGPPRGPGGPPRGQYRR